MPIWQRNYYEHIIRSEKSLSRIREYIAANPILWDQYRDRLRESGQIRDKVFKTGMFEHGPIDDEMIEIIHHDFPNYDNEEP